MSLLLKDVKYLPEQKLEQVQRPEEPFVLLALTIYHYSTISRSTVLLPIQQPLTCSHLSSVLTILCHGP